MQVHAERCGCCRTQASTYALAVVLMGAIATQTFGSRAGSGATAWSRELNASTQHLSSEDARAGMQRWTLPCLEAAAKPTPAPETAT